MCLYFRKDRKFNEFVGVASIELAYTHIHINYIEICGNTIYGIHVAWQKVDTDLLKPPTVLHAQLYYVLYMKFPATNSIVCNGRRFWVHKHSI